MPLLDHVERGLELADLLALPAALDYFSVASRAVISQERQVLTAPDASRLARPAVVADQGSKVRREACQPALERFGCQILVAHAYHAAAVVALHGVVDAPDVVVGRVVQVAADDLDAEGLQAANLHVRTASIDARLWLSTARARAGSSPQLVGCPECRTDARASSLRQDHARR